MRDARFPVKISVAMLAYNHERFLAQALESALAQQTRFPFEIVLSEDCSSDRTREIASHYAQAHPDRIRLLLSEKNLGLTRNTARTLDACRGEYVAILEGDDYWIHPEKLQRQADYLDAHPECAWCFTRAIVVDAGGQTLEVPPAIRTVRSQYALADYLAREFQPRFCTVMFRHRLFPAFPDWFFKMPTADLPLHVLNTERGGMIGFVDQEMAAYRIHPGGAWSQGMRPEEWSARAPEQLAKVAARSAALVDLYQNVDRHLGGLHRPILRRQIAAFAQEWSALNRALGDRAALRRSALVELSAQVSTRDLFRSGPWLSLLESYMPQFKIAPRANSNAT